MTGPAVPPRPRQVTLAAWLIMLGSVLVVLTVFERISGLQSLETQASVQRFLSEPPGADLGLGLEGVLGLLRTLAMVAGGCAAAAAILGYHVLRRNRGARLGLTVLALPLFVSGMVAGGFMSSVVVAAAVMLWFQPARDWFDGITREKPTPAERAKPAEQAEPPPAPEVERRPEPRAVPGFGAAPGSPAGQSSVESSVESSGPPWPTEAPVRAGVGARRPSAVLWACIVTWTVAGLSVLVMAASIAVLAASPDSVLDELHRQNPQFAEQGISDRVVLNLTFGIGGALIVWSLLAIVLAVLVFRRVGWARLPLVISAAVAAALCLLAAVQQPAMVLPVAACVVTLALLLRPDSRAWFAR